MASSGLFTAWVPEMTVCTLPVVERSLYQSAVPLKNNQGNILCASFCPQTICCSAAAASTVHTTFVQVLHPLRDRIEDVDIPHNRKHVSFQILKRGTALVLLQMAAGLHQGLQRMSTDTFFGR